MARFLSWLLGLPGAVQRGLLLAAVSVAVLAVAYVAVRQDAIRSERARVEQQDQTAEDAARSARGRVSDCYDAGGVWDQSTGVCHRRVPRVPGP